MIEDKHFCRYRIYYETYTFRGYKYFRNKTKAQDWVEFCLAQPDTFLYLGAIEEVDYNE